MESAFSYLAGLVGAFDDVGQEHQTKKNKKRSSSAASSCSQAAIPSCGINVTNSTEDYCGGGFHHYDVEQGHEDDNLAFQDKDENDIAVVAKIHPSASNQSGRSRKQPQKTIGILNLKVGRSNRLSLLQSFSAASSNSKNQNQHPIDVTKSRSSLSNTTRDSSSNDDDDTGFGWAESLSSSSGDYDEEHPSRKSPAKHHIQWFAHGIVWTCMAITFGWVGVGLSYAARQSTEFVQLNDPMYLDPRYETIPGIGMIRVELCFNQTHLDILEDLNENDFRLEGERLQLGVQPRTTRNSNKIDTPLALTTTQDYYEAAAAAEDEFADDDDETGPSVVDQAIASCFIHRLTSDDVHDDHMYTFSRAMAFLAMVLGGFVMICLTFSAFWKTINLRPIGMGLLVAYFFQSFTFLIFDSNLCKDNMGCSLSGGGTYSAVASVCYILACAASARMDRRKFRNDEKAEIAALGKEYRDYEYGNEYEYERSEHQRSKRINLEQQHPLHVVIEKEMERKGIDPPEKRCNSKKISREEEGLTKPKPVSPDRRASTAETANISSDEESALNSEGEIFISALPEIAHPSERSLKKKSKKPRSATSISDDNNTEQVEKPKKPRSKSSKSKKKKNRTQDGEESRESSVSSTSISTKEEKTQEPKSSRRKKKSREKSQREVRSLSPCKSIDMAGDVADAHVAAIMKNSAWISDREIHTEKRSSSQPHRFKSTPRSKNAAMRASVRQSIEEGRHYEL